MSWDHFSVFRLEFLNVWLDTLETQVSPWQNECNLLVNSERLECGHYEILCLLKDEVIQNWLAQA